MATGLTNSIKNQTGFTRRDPFQSDSSLSGAGKVQRLSSPSTASAGKPIRSPTRANSVTSNSCFCLQADGLKEGDYIVAVGETDCKWLGVTEVMRLLKDVNEEAIEIQVISVMDSSPSMVGHVLFMSPEYY